MAVFFQNQRLHQSHTSSKSVYKRRQGLGYFVAVVREKHDSNAHTSFLERHTSSKE